MINLSALKDVRHIVYSAGLRRLVMGIDPERGALVLFTESREGTEWSRRGGYQLVPHHAIHNFLREASDLAAEKDDGGST